MYEHVYRSLCVCLCVCMRVYWMYHRFVDGHARMLNQFFSFILIFHAFQFFFFFCSVCCMKLHVHFFRQLIFSLFSDKKLEGFKFSFIETERKRDRQKSWKSFKMMTKFSCAKSRKYTYIRFYRGKKCNEAYLSHSRLLYMFRATTKKTN